MKNRNTITLSILFLLMLYLPISFAQDSHLSALPKKIIAGHTPYVACIMYSPDGGTLASGGINGDVHLWDAKTGQHIQTLVELTDMEKAAKVDYYHRLSGRFKKMVTSLAYTPDGKLLAYGTMDNKIHIWDTENRKYIRMLDPHSDQKHKHSYMLDVRHSHSVNALAFSPDGKILASGGMNEEIRLWNTKRGWWYKTSKDPEDTVTAISFSPDGKTFITNGNDNKVDIWDIKRGKLKQNLEFRSNTGKITCVAYAPDGKTIATGSIDKTIYCWNAVTGVLRLKLSGHTNCVTSVTFSPDGNILASASYDRTIRLWNTETGHHQTTLSGQMGHYTSVVFSPDGQELAAASDDGSIFIWNLSSIKQLEGPEPDKNSKQNISRSQLPGGVKISFSDGWTNDIAYSPDGSRLAITSNIGIRICNATTGSQVALFKTLKSIEQIVYSPDGRKLVASSSSELFSLDSMTGTSIYIIPMSHRFFYSPNGSTIAGWSDCSNWRWGPMQLWNAEIGQKIQTFKESFNSSNSLTFSPDGKTIAYGVHKNVQLWNVEKGKHKQTLSGHTLAVENVIYSPDGKTLASIGRNINGYKRSSDIEILLWDVKSGNLKHTLPSDRDISTLLFSPDGKTLAGGCQLWIYLWDVATGKIRHKLNGGIPFVYTPDGKTLASVNANIINKNNIILWDTLSGEKVKTLKGHTKGVTLLRCSPDGKTLTSLSLQQDEIRIWDLGRENKY